MACLLTWLDQIEKGQFAAIVGPSGKPFVRQVERTR